MTINKNNMSNYNQNLHYFQYRQLYDNNLFSYFLQHTLYTTFKKIRSI